MGSLARCGLLFATPISREEFDAACSAERRSDYVMGQLRGRSPDKLWAEEYSNTAEAARELAESARELGVAVFRSARLADFTQATGRFPTVIVFAHWRGVMFRPSDFDAGPAAIAERIRSDDMLRRIRLQQNHAQAVADALNAAVSDLALLDALPERIAEEGRRTRVLGRTLCRDLIDERLRGMVRPGNRMEFVDGLYPPLRVEQAMAPDFEGELDLAMCNSAALATVIDMRRGSRLRHLHWPEYVLPEPQYLKVKWTLRDMAANSGDYISTRLSIEAREPRDKS